MLQLFDHLTDELLHDRAGDLLHNRACRAGDHVADGPCNRGRKVSLRCLRRRSEILLQRVAQGLELVLGRGGLVLELRTCRSDFLQRHVAVLVDLGERAGLGLLHLVKCSLLVELERLRRVLDGPVDDVPHLLHTLLLRLVQLLGLQVAFQSEPVLCSSLVGLRIGGHLSLAPGSRGGCGMGVEVSVAARAMPGLCDVTSMRLSHDSPSRTRARLCELFNAVEASAL